MANVLPSDFDFEKSLKKAKTFLELHSDPDLSELLPRAKDCPSQTDR